MSYKPIFQNNTNVITLEQHDFASKKDIITILNLFELYFI